jgi:thiosulfate/3-mercaptopyruvate sulfurtransferase
LGSAWEFNYLPRIFLRNLFLRGSAMLLPPLVEPDRVMQHPDWVVLDIRSPVSFQQGHCPNSILTDYAQDGWRRSEGGAHGLLPLADQLSALFSYLGLRPDDTLIIFCAGTDATDLAAAARIFWTLKVAGHRAVSILNGGWRAWVEEGGAIETGPAQKRPPSSYPITLDPCYWSPVEDVEKVLESDTAALVDARPYPFFKGQAKTGAARRAGRLPGAYHIDYTEGFDQETGRLRPVDTLKTLFADVPAGPVISYCNTGHTAALNWFILSQVLGRKDATLFDGSMTQWTQDERRAVEVG